MRPESQCRQALESIEAEVKDCEIGRRLPSGTNRYRYTRYMFTNASTDILGIFTDALDLLGVHWTQTNTRTISIARRDDVAFLDSFIGPKC